MTAPAPHNARLPANFSPIGHAYPCWPIRPGAPIPPPPLQLIAGNSVMVQPEPSPLITKFLATLCPMTVVLTHRNHDDEHIVLLCDGDRYAVCRLHPGRRLATAPNYHVESGEGQLRSPLSKDGLLDLLHWTDIAAARDRYARLTLDPEGRRETPSPPSLRLVDIRRDSE